MQLQYAQTGQIGASEELPDRLKLYTEQMYPGTAPLLKSVLKTTKKVLDNFLHSTTLFTTQMLPN
jgi:hypothetical protein